VDAESVRQRRVDLERLLGLLDLLLLPEVGERPHVVQPVGQLDDDDADVLRHRDDHLAVVLGLVLLARGELDLRQLRDAVDQQPHVVTEAGADVVARDVRVLDHVVQQRRRQHDVGLAQARADLRHAPRVEDVLLPALAELAVVMGARERERLGDEPEVGVGVVGRDVLDQLVEELAVTLGNDGEGDGHG
jgi:hypothetical protein